MYFWLSSCVEEYSQYMTFNCTLQDVMTADMTGTSLEMETSNLEQCKSKSVCNDMFTLNFWTLKLSL